MRDAHLAFAVGVATVVILITDLVLGPSLD
jgi:hypothetical protein